MSIPSFGDKIKRAIGEHRQRLIFIGILAATAILAFLLGYAARGESASVMPSPASGASSSLEDPLAAAGEAMPARALDPVLPATPAVSETPLTGSGAYVASKTGKKYYPVGCGGAKRIKDANKVFYATAAQAQAAGLTLGAGCSD